jgi:undecaprenyl-diphosphatase
MDLIAATFYGLIQGLTEFLPVSSSGHLALLPHWLGIEDPGVVFDLSMHVGTALSIALYFRKDIVGLSKELFSCVKERSFNRQEGARALNMTFATLITVIGVLLLKDLAKDFGRSPTSIAFNLIVFGLFMLVSDKVMKDEETGQMERTQWIKAGAIGLFQALAIFPGVSRSGATLTISRFLNLGRDEASRFSFLLSLPLIVAGFIYKFPEFLKGGESFDIGLCLIGMGISFITGLVTIHYFLKFIKKAGLLPFALYRVVMAFVVWKSLA